MAKINILAISNGVGISRDVEIIKNILTLDGHQVEYNHTFKIIPKHRYDLNIHLERFNPKTFQLADKNVMIPNQEWFEPPWLSYIDMFDYFLVKTKFAEEIFKKLGKTTYIGFTSEDRYLNSVKKDPNHWIHVAGKSIQKQTDTIIKTWEENPGFPTLTIVQDVKFWKPRKLARNINYMIDRVPDDLLKMMQNVNSVHVCCSSTEGFGHYIMEALSCKSIVITTDAPPMNELITPDRGVLIPYYKEEKMNLSTKFLIKEKNLADSVVKTMVMDDFIKNQITEASRKYYLDNDKEFRNNLQNAIKEILS